MIPNLITMFYDHLIKNFFALNFTIEAIPPIHIPPSLSYFFLNFLHIYFNKNSQKFQIIFKYGRWGSNPHSSGLEDLCLSIGRRPLASTILNRTGTCSPMIGAELPHCLVPTYEYPLLHSANRRGGNRTHGNR